MLVSVEEKSAVDKEKMGKRIKVVRKKSGLTQEAFGDRISGRILKRGFGSAYFFHHLGGSDANLNHFGLTDFYYAFLYALFQYALFVILLFTADFLRFLIHILALSIIMSKCGFCPSRSKIISKVRRI